MHVHKNGVDTYLVQLTQLIEYTGGEVAQTTESDGIFDNAKEKFGTMLLELVDSRRALVDHDNWLSRISDGAKKMTAEDKFHDEIALLKNMDRQLLSTVQKAETQCEHLNTALANRQVSNIHANATALRTTLDKLSGECQSVAQAVNNLRDSMGHMEQLITALHAADDTMAKNIMTWMTHE